jgi:hypothetical protein
MNLVSGRTRSVDASSRQNFADVARVATAKLQNSCLTLSSITNSLYVIVTSSRKRNMLCR